MADEPRGRAGRVRFYRHGLGECALLSMGSSDHDRFHVLIDCGLAHGVERAASRMTDVVRDLAALVDGVIDLVVVTQARWNHVSGFIQAEQLFNRMRIGEVWLPSSEDPRFEDTVRATRRDASRNLWILANRARGQGEDPEGHAAKVRSLAGTFGPATGPAVCEAIDVLRQHPSCPVVRYLGDREWVGKIPTLRAGRLRVLCHAPNQPLEAAPHIRNPAGSAGEAGQPFESRYRLAADKAEALPFFRTQYLADKDQWRRLDAQSTSSTESFALALDRWSSHTSLTLAVELEPNGRTLLFPGDIPANLWWDSFESSLQPVTGPIRETESRDRAGRVVLLKLGRHGGPGSLPEPEDLALLHNPEMTVLISGSRQDAARLGWSLPAPRVVETLRQRFPGRVFASDDPQVGSDSQAQRRNGPRLELDPAGLYLDIIYPAGTTRIARATESAGTRARSESGSE